MSQLYNRICVLNVFKREETKSPTTGASALLDIDMAGTQFRSVMADGSPGFRIKFHLQKATGPVPFANACQISIYNVGPTSRKLLSQLNNLVVLQAGYGKSALTIFTGNICSAKTSKHGPDYITELVVGDGLYAYQNSMVNLSFESGMTQAQIISALVTALKDQGVTTGVIDGVPSTPYNKGVIVSGRTTDKIKEICEKNDLQFSIQDSKVHIIPYGAALPNTIILISEDTGMIGMPVITDLTIMNNAVNLEAGSAQVAFEPGTQNPNLAPRISVRCLMNPGIGCYQKVAVKSKFINGNYTTTLVSHTGDTWGNDWFTDAECSS